MLTLDMEVFDTVSAVTTGLVSVGAPGMTPTLTELMIQLGKQGGPGPIAGQREGPGAEVERRDGESQGGEPDGESFTHASAE